MADLVCYVFIWVDVVYREMKKNAVQHFFVSNTNVYVVLKEYGGSVIKWMITMITGVLLFEKMCRAFISIILYPLIV